MRNVFKLLALAVFAAGTTLTVGCGETATEPAPAPAETESSSATPADGNSVAGATQVSFDVTGMS